MWREENEEEIPVDDFKISISVQSISANNGVLIFISAALEVLRPLVQRYTILLNRFTLLNNDLIWTAYYISWLHHKDYPTRWIHERQIIQSVGMVGIFVINILAK